MIEQVSKGDYDIRGFDRTTHLIELAWYATGDNKVVGVVAESQEDHKFSWCIFTENDSGPGFTGIDLGVSIDTEEDATLELHDAMAAEVEIQRLKSR